MKIKNFQYKNVEASSTLLFVAIVIELLVAGLGVFLGIVMVTEGTTQVEVPLLNRFVPAMMFFVVAVVELTRVPLIISIYRSHSFLWRIFGSLFLLLIMFIAFETMSVGFKRNVMMMEGDLNFFRIDKNNLTNQLDSIVDEIEENKDLTLEKINQNFNDTIDNLNKERENRLAPYYKTLDDIETAKSGALGGALGNQIENLNQQIAQVNEQRNNELSNIENRISKQVNDLNSQISELNNKKIQVNAQISALPTSIFGPSRSKLEPLENEIEIINESISSKERQVSNLNNSINSELNKINSKFDKSINDLQNQLNQANQKAIENETIQDNSYAGQVQNANKAIQDITDDINQRENEAKEFKSNQLARLETKTNNIENLTLQKVELQKQINDLNNSINKETQGNLIYQFAENFSFVPSCSGVTQPSDVSTECKAFVESIWFGSLSAVIAVTGTAVALGSEVLRTSSARKKSNPYGKRPMRYLLAGIYKYVRRPRIKIEEKIVEKPVEVIKEVPVQKIEYVEVAKIQDVVQKEIVHVPLFTNDESLIDLSKDRKKKKNSDESN